MTIQPVMQHLQEVMVSYMIYVLLALFLFSSLDNLGFSPVDSHVLMSVLFSCFDVNDDLLHSFMSCRHVDNRNQI